jgi:hypothetical protein
MLHAIYHNKFQRSFIKENEDWLTAWIFERLGYFPKEIL